MDWDHLRHFLATARTGKISEACKSLGVDHSTVSRRIRSLELDLGVQLFNRSPLGYNMTEDGHKLLVRAERIEAEFSRAQQDAENQDDAPSGVVRIGAPDGFAALILAPKLAEFCSGYPDLSIELFSAPRWLSLSRRDADIAISLSKPKSGRQRVTKLVDFTLREYVSTRVKAEVSTLPRTGYIHDLYFDDSLDVIDSFKGDANPDIACSSVLAQLEIVRTGEGKGVLADFLVQRHPEMVPTEPDRPPLERTLWLRVHEDMADLIRVRKTIDYLVSMCRSDRKLFTPSIVNAAGLEPA